MDKKRINKNYTPTIGELLKYNNDYYILNELIKNGNEILPKYNIYNFLNKKDVNTIIYSNNLIFIPDKILQKNIKDYLIFAEKYNSTSDKFDKFNKLEIINVEQIVHEIFNKCKLNINTLFKILNCLKYNKKPELKIDNLFTNPFDFISEEYQLITFDKAEHICLEFNLDIDFKVKCKAWIYDFFIRQNNSFYVDKSYFNKMFENFCQQKKENLHEYQKYTNKYFLIDKEINNVTYKTTNHFLNKEKKITDKCINLFYEKTYNIEKERIIEKINIFEENKTRQKKTLFKLENDQKRSVISGIQNKLSIITGFPGSGKTEIVQCINFILYELNEENKSNKEIEQKPYNYNEMGNIYVNPSDVSLIAPTGLAFINLKASQQPKHYNIQISGTCHRLLYHTFQNIKKHKKLNGCDCKEECKYNFFIKLFIIDEVSMIDIFLFDEILKMCDYFNSRLIVIGDVNQLPSIGPGTVLQNLLDSNFFSSNELTKIKRQSDGSLVKNIVKMSKTFITRNDMLDETLQL
ncbi:MAG: AAA family ATPase, partial [Candidatus Paceibacterota bacterium]